MRLIRNFLIIGTILFFVVSCKEKASEKTAVVETPEQVTQFAEPTPASNNGPRVMVTPIFQTPCQRGDISGANIEPLRIIFIGLPFDSKHIGETVNSGVSIEPKIDGIWRWNESNELTFFPKTDWYGGIDYRVKFSQGILPSRTVLAPAQKDCNGNAITDRSEYCFRVYSQCFDLNSVRVPFSMVVPKIPTTVTDVVPDQFVLNFENPVGLTLGPDRPILSGITISPSIKGVWRWQTEKSLTFSPAEPWPQDTKYDLTLSDAVFAEDAIIPGYKYSFRTPISDVKKARMQSTLLAPEAPAKEKDPKPSVLKLTFTEPVAGTNLIGKDLTVGVNLTPAIAGIWKWNSERELIFTPTVHWPSHQYYQLYLNGEAFGDKADSFSGAFSFRSPIIGIGLSHGNLSVDPENPRIKRVVVTAEFSHPLNRTEFERAVSLSLVEKKNKAAVSYVGFKVTYDELGRAAYINSDPIEIPKQDSIMQIRIATGVHSSLPITGTSAATQAEVYVPGVESYFRIDEVSFQNVENRKQGEDQVLVISASAGLSPQVKDSVTAYLLPKYFPGTDTEEDSEPYTWDNIAEITTKIITASEKVPLELLATEQEHSSMASFRFKAESNRYLFVDVAAGLKSVDGYSLAKEHNQTVFVGVPNKAIKILAPGALLSLSGEKKVSVLVRDVAKMDIEVARVLPGSLINLVSQTGGNFQNPYFKSYQFGPDDLTERITETRQFAVEEKGKAQYTALEFGSLLNTKNRVPRGLFLIKLNESGNKNDSAFSVKENNIRDGEGEPEEEESENSEEELSDTVMASDHRLVLVTDLGLVVKKNRFGTQDVFVQDLAKGEPADGAIIRVLGRNGLPIFEKKVGADGHAAVPNLSSFNREKEPRVYIAERGEDITFMPYSRDDRQINLSRFDIGGLESVSDAPGIQGYVFSDRGVYRPGDEIHFGVVVKPDDWKSDYTDVPLKAVITDPRGIEVRQETIKLTNLGFTEISYRSDVSSTTGSYQLGLYVEKDNKRGSLLGSTTVRVEEFLPDRMRINVALSATKLKGWIKPEQLVAKINLQNLFGTPAQDRKVRGRMQLQPSNLVFPELPGFSFSDPLRAKESFDEELPENQTDKDGEAQFDLNLERFVRATYRLNVFASGFEGEGGRSVSGITSAIISPLESLVGFKPVGDLRYIAKGNKAEAELIAVNPDLQKIALKNLKGDFVESRWLSVLTKQPNGTYTYQSVRKDVPINSRDLEITAKGINVDLDTGNPGDFALIVRDASGLELNRIVYTVVGAGNLSANLEANAELDVRLNQNDFAPGDEIEVSVRSPYAGAGLITIEKDKVYGFAWFKSSERSSVQKIRVPQGLEGNGYVNVTFVRALNSQDIYLSPLSYAVVPFSIDRERRRAKLNVKAPDEIKPGKDLEIKYSGSTGKAVIFVVDEGILQYARYQTPDPLSYFFRKRALEVNTSQILDLLMPEYSIERALSAAGGDEDLMRKHLNPFKRRRAAPVAAWSGIVDVSQEERTFRYSVPEYFNGSLRVMAVAIAADAVESSERKTTVRGDYVVTPNVPAAVSPGDEFIVSATVSNTNRANATAAKTKISIRPAVGLEVIGEAIAEREIKPGDESAVVFRLKAKPELGPQSLRFEASSSSGAAGITEEVSVRPASPLTTSIQAGAVDLSAQNKIQDVKINRRNVYPFGEKYEASASPLPLGFARGLSQYLSSYPYGCTEQLVSRMLPQLVLLDQPAFGVGNRKAVEKALNQTIRTLRSRQGRDGGIALWYAGGYVSNTVHLYATLFLLEAKERHFAVPGELLKDALRYTEGVAAASPPVVFDAAFASYLLARSGKPVNSQVVSLRSWLEADVAKNLGNWKRERPGMFLAATYKLMQDDTEAKKLFSNSTITTPVALRYDDYYNSFIHGSIYLYLAAKHFPEQMQGLAPSAIQNYLGPLIKGTRDYSTHSASWAVLALDAYIRAQTAGDKASFTVASLDSVGTATELPINDPLYPSFNLATATTALRFTADRLLYYQIYQEGYDKESPREVVANGLDVSRQILDSAGKEVAMIPLGEKVTVVLRIRAKGDSAIKNVVLVDMLPGGTEVVMSASRFSESAKNGRWGFGLPETTYTPDYADVREDRVLLFGTIPNDRVVEFRYQLNATNRGSFIVPPVYAESMYDKSVTAVGLGKTLVVGESDSAQATENVK